MDKEKGTMKPSQKFGGEGFVVVVELLTMDMHKNFMVT